MAHKDKKLTISWLLREQIQTQDDGKLCSILNTQRKSFHASWCLWCECLSLVFLDLHWLTLSRPPQSHGWLLPMRLLSAGLLLFLEGHWSC